MNVVLESPLDDYQLNGSYDPVVAEENECKFRLSCSECNSETIGTNWDLHDLGWQYSFSIDENTMHITESDALCPQCNGNKQQELDLHEKAVRDDKQKTIGEIVK